MLISEQVEPYDDKDSIFELKLDGCRCIAYCDNHSVDLRNKRSRKHCKCGKEGIFCLCSFWMSTKDIQRGKGKTKKRINMVNHMIDGLLDCLISKRSIRQEDSDIYCFGLPCYNPD